MSSPSGGPEVEAEMQNQAPGSHLIMVFAFGSFCLGNMHHADWLKLRTLYPYLTYIPKNSTCDHI